MFFLSACLCKDKAGFYCLVSQTVSRLEVDRKHKIYVLDEETSAAPGEEGCMQFDPPYLLPISDTGSIFMMRKKLDAPGSVRRQAGIFPSRRRRSCPDWEKTSS